MKRSLIVFLCIFLSGISSADIKRSNMAASSIMKIHESSIPPLPEGVVAVEYLESTGTQWIDTQFTFTSNTCWDVLFIPLENPNLNLWVLGCQNANNKVYGIRISSNNELMAMYGESRIDLYGSNIGITVKSILSNDIISIGNLSMTRNGDTGIFNWSAALFAWRWNNNGNPSGKSCCRILYAKLYNDFILKRYFIPVRFINQNNEIKGALYDIVSNELFTNQGTGNFIIGPDKH